MPESIRHRSSFSEFYIDEECYITEVSNSEDDPDLSVALARVKPSVTTQWHQLMGITERYCIISGTGIVEVGDLEPQQVSMGDVVVIPQECRQRITNTGNTDLLFYVVCSPRFQQDAYQQL